jgi:predicted transposase/invertase (TIGR01784 family)
MKLWNSPGFRQNPLKKCEVPVMEQAYHQEGNRGLSVRHPSGSVEVQITAESTFRESMRLYELARHNEASALRHARDEGEAKGEAKKAIEIARKMKNAGRPLNEIMEFTGLPAESIEKM